MARLNLGLIPAQRLSPEPGPQQVCDLEPSQACSPPQQWRGRGAQGSTVVSILWLLLRYHLWAALFHSFSLSSRLGPRGGVRLPYSIWVDFLLSALGGRSTLV